MPALHLEHLAVRFRAGLGARARRTAAIECGLARWHPRHDLPGEVYALIPLANSRGSGPGKRPRSPRAPSAASRHRAATALLATHRHVIRVAPVFRHGRALVIATDRIWLGLEPGSQGRAVLASLRRRGARLLETRAGDHVLRLPPRQDPRIECRRLAGLAGVRYAEPDHVIVGRSLSTTRTAARIQPALKAIGAPSAWLRQPTSRSVLVAVLDCGVLGSHPDLRGTVVGSFDATGGSRALRPPPWDSHGTECAGLVAATGRAPHGIVGAAPGCRLLAVRVGCTPSRLADYVSKTSWLVQGIDWAWRHGAAVLSMSFGGGPRATPVVRALERARTLGRGGRGTVLVAAVGNDGDAPVEFPARAPGVLGVAAVDARGRAVSFSNRGPAVDLAAPGVNLTTTTVPDPAEDEPSWYLTDQGTSLATPLVAGVAALVIAANPTLSETAVRRLLARTARRHGQRRHRVGAGLIDAGRALAATPAPAGGRGGEREAR